MIYKLDFADAKGYGLQLIFPIAHRVKYSYDSTSHKDLAFEQPGYGQSFAKKTEDELE